MIPSTNTKLLASEDWTKIYQSFKNADFKSYDFDTLKRTMISYLQDNYPEDFNDYIESSEYIALIDLIAFLGQNLSFRVDLNARENFLETAQRRDSILRLAQLVGYNPSRNIPAHGFLKVVAVNTSDSVYDTNGINLADTTITWNDTTNSNWYQQFLTILNSAMVTSFGNSTARKSIDGVMTELYSINSSNTDVPIYNFVKSISGTIMSFEIVPCTFDDKNYVYELPPRPASSLSFIYRNDNQGSASSNSGFFFHFRQGTLGVNSFTIDTPVPNEIIGVNVPSVNDTDIWLWQNNLQGNFETLWTKVPSFSGNNVIYNSINKSVRTLYAIASRTNDQIDLNFADGVFGDLPKGKFTLFYRQSNGLSYVIKPEQLSGIVINVPYINSLGQSHTLQITLSLQYVVDNSAGAETDAMIQLKAPQTYYTQNRMITAEDYNIAPLNAGSDILKIKSVNRISSGISKYFDLSDVSGNYSRTNIFANDGILYKEEEEKVFEFSVTSTANTLGIIKTTIADIVLNSSMELFYIEHYDRISLSTLALKWKLVNSTPGQSRGYFYNDNGAYAVGPGYTDNNLRFVKVNCLIKFNAPTGKYFDEKNYLKTIVNNIIPLGGKTSVWSTVIQIINDGATLLDDGTGPLILESNIPDGAVPIEVIPAYQSSLGYSLENEIINQTRNYRNFGLTINKETRSWDIILNSNLDLVNDFSLNFQENTEDQGLDASWLLSFTWVGSNYRVNYRTLNYIFESEAETGFYIDKTTVNYDFTNNTVVRDYVSVLSINTIPNANLATTLPLGYDRLFQIDDAIIEIDGYVQPNKVKINFYDLGSANVVDPNSFYDVVGVNYVFFKKNSNDGSWSLTREDVIVLDTEQNILQSYKVEGQLFYFKDSQLVKYWSSVIADVVLADMYKGRTGRSDLKFHYVHNSGTQRRIDPSKTNIIDLYVLTTSYDTSFKNYIQGVTTTEPMPPTSQELEQNYSEYLEPIKSISDEIIYHPVKYKVLFGNKATLNLQAKFKAVRNSNRSTNDNNLKSRILTAINDFFSLENWDFGQQFYFGELSAYVMNVMTPDITNFIIVPVVDNGFGSLFEVSCLSNEIFINGTTIDNIEIISGVTSSQLKSSESIITST